MKLVFLLRAMHQDSALEKKFIGGKTASLHSLGLPQDFVVNVTHRRCHNGTRQLVDDLEDVSGIGPATLEELRLQVTV